MHRFPLSDHLTKQMPKARFTSATWFFSDSLGIKNPIVVKFSSKLFQENHPTNPSTKTSSKKAQKKNTSLLKKKGGRKNSENSTLCHAVIFFAGSTIVSLFSGTPRLQFRSQVHDFTKTLANV